MDGVVRAMTVALPLLLLPLLAGLGLLLHVVIHEGRSRSAAWARVVGVVDLLMVVPFAALAWAAQTDDVRGMFAFASVAYAIIGGLALRMVARYRE
jgi:predicted membrane protein